MHTVSIKYTLKWRFKKYHNIQITNCKKIINTKTNKILKQCLNGGSIGYWIGRKFIPKRKLNENIEIIPKKEYCPF